MKMLKIFFFLVILCTAYTANAIPTIQSASSTDGETTITLRILDQAILGDQQSWCEVHIYILGTEDELTAGDELNIWVYEDDVIFNDVVYEESTTVTSQEASASNGGLVDRTIDCSAYFRDDDSGDHVEMFARAELNRDSRWFDEEPATDQIVIPIIEDDDFEEDDDSGQAEQIGLGTSENRISNDGGDWVSFELTDSYDVEIAVIHNPQSGRLLAFLEDEQGNSDVNFVQEDDKTVARATLSQGTYYAMIHPRVASNPNFYDLGLVVAPASCSLGDMDTRECGSCGSMTRNCGDDRTWEDFGDCTGEGECIPESQSLETCGNCGSKATVCSDSCAWLPPGPCEGEGECPVDSVDEEDCGEEQVRQRVCGESCSWGEFGDCGAAICEEDAVRDCYTGPEGTQGVGACSDGTQQCIGEIWSDCDEETRPTMEVCDDSIDNDCDGNTDYDDSDCEESLSGIGDSCETNGGCEAPLDCVNPPDHPMFFNGYCGLAGCRSNSECGDEGFCKNIFNEDYCLKPCVTVSNCRTGYHCITLQGQKVCAPRCESDNHCLDENFPTCESGLCVEDFIEPDTGPTDTGQPDTGTPDTNTPDTDSPDVGTPDSDQPEVGEDVGIDTTTADDQTESEEFLEPESIESCGCSLARTRPAHKAVLALLLLWGGLILRRRTSVL